MADKTFVVKNGLSVNTSLLTANNGSVGVNTASPDATLTVAGSANVRGQLRATGAVIFDSTLQIGGVYINATGDFTGTAANALLLEGQGKAYYDAKADAAFTNAAAVAVAQGSAAYTNAAAVAVAQGSAAYTNAIAFANTRAVAAYTNAIAIAANASNLTSGTVPSGRISGAYTGITSVGTLGANTSVRHAVDTVLEVGTTNTTVYFGQVRVTGGNTTFMTLRNNYWGTDAKQWDFHLGHFDQNYLSIRAVDDIYNTATNILMFTRPSVGSYTAVGAVQALFTADVYERGHRVWSANTLSKSEFVANNGPATVTTLSANGGASFGVFGTSTSSYGVYGTTTNGSQGGVLGYAQNGSTYAALGYQNTYALYGNGYVLATGINTASDERLKENIETLAIAEAIEIIRKLRVVGFDWKENSDAARMHPGWPRRDVGLIAQEAATSEIPGFVLDNPSFTNPNPPEDYVPSLNEELGSFLSVNYPKAIPYLITIVQNLMDRVDALEKAQPQQKTEKRRRG